MVDASNDLLTDITATLVPLLTIFSLPYHFFNLLFINPQETQSKYWNFLILACD